MKEPCVYILASRERGTLYIGVTSSLAKRVFEHRNGMMSCFTQSYGVSRLVWFEHQDSMYTAITREKQLKVWQRAWKLELIEKSNPGWRDLYGDIL